MIDVYITSGTSPTVSTTEPLSLADRIERIGACFDSRRTRRDVGGLQDHDFQAGQGRPYSVIPYWHLRSFRPSVCCSVVAKKLGQ
jgi:hypothetical protein